jgi:hypothetical protein
MKKLAVSSGVVLYESENKLYISKESGTATGTLLFVTGLLAFILLGNGILQLTVFKNQLPNSSKLGMLLIGIGIILAVVFWKVRSYQKKQAAKPLQQLQTICILDFGTNHLLDSQQRILTPIHEVWLTRKIQITSSSPELLLQWNRGSITIVKGNPFSGGIGDIEKVLMAKGVNRK